MYVILIAFTVYFTKDLWTEMSVKSTDLSKMTINNMLLVCYDKINRTKASFVYPHNNKQDQNIVWTILEKNISIYKKRPTINAG